jgi:hypothetical protein
MKSSMVWFNSKMGQNTYVDIGSLPAIIKSGVNSNPSPDSKDKDEKGRKFFVVGKTVVGGEEVVG